MEGFSNLERMLQVTIQRMKEPPRAPEVEIRKGERLLRELINANRMAIEERKLGDYLEKVATVNAFIRDNRTDIDEGDITDDELGGGSRRRKQTKRKQKRTRKGSRKKRTKRTKRKSKRYNKKSRRH